MSTALIAYQDRLASPRRKLKDQPQLRQLMEADADPQQLHAFLIQWAALTIQLQEPAERFLVAASRRCVENGERQLSLTLLQIAREAIERYRLVADDTRRLTQLWNERWPSHINLTHLLTQPPSAAAKRLHNYQHDLVDGPQPWTQLAVVYETEAALASVARRVSDQTEALLGADARRCLRSLDAISNFAEQGSLRQTMLALLEACPERMQQMATTGQRSLEVYLDFLGECCLAASYLSCRRDPRRAFG